MSQNCVNLRYWKNKNKFMCFYTKTTALYSDICKAFTTWELMGGARFCFETTDF